MNMFFWLFEARHDPDAAPLVIYLAGGPGGAVEGSVFSENGPCTMRGQNTTSTLSPYSFNEHANVLYIDQPIGAGFSYGTESITSTDAATEYVWKLLQAFLADPAFTKFRARKFGIIGASYVGHTGPSLGQEILRRNEDIVAGRQQGERIHLVAMGLQNAWMDAGIQQKANLEYAYSNDYRSLIDESTYHRLSDYYLDEFQPEVGACRLNGSQEDCLDAYKMLNRLDIQVEIAANRSYKDWTLAYSLYDIRPGATFEHSKGLLKYLEDPKVRHRINAKTQFAGRGGGERILKTGDSARSFIPEMADLLSAGVNLVIYSGDADYVCSWPGTLGVAEAVQWLHKDDFLQAPLEHYTVDGTQKGELKSFKNLSFVRVFEAGHDIDASEPETHRQIFEQMMKGKLVST